MVARATIPAAAFIFKAGIKGGFADLQLGPGCRLVIVAQLSRR